METGGLYSQHTLSVCLSQGKQPISNSSLRHAAPSPRWLPGHAEKETNPPLRLLWLQQSVHQELPPQSTSQDTHRWTFCFTHICNLKLFFSALSISIKEFSFSSLCRWETLQVHVGRLHVEVCSFRRADKTLPQAHRSQTLPVPWLWAQLLPFRSPGTAQETPPPGLKGLHGCYLRGTRCWFQRGAVPLWLEGGDFTDLVFHIGRCSSGCKFKILSPRKPGCELVSH